MFLSIRIYLKTSIKKNSLPILISRIWSVSLRGLNVKVGGSYIDFSAPDLEGNMVKLSDQIKGKVALIDLWASWCESCRRLSSSMIPIYEAFKDKGFTVVGIARENNNTDAMKRQSNRTNTPG